MIIIPINIHRFHFSQNHAKSLLQTLDDMRSNLILKIKHNTPYIIYNRIEGTFRWVTGRQIERKKTYDVKY